MKGKIIRYVGESGQDYGCGVHEKLATVLLRVDSMGTRVRTEAPPFCYAAMTPLCRKIAAQIIQKSHLFCEDVTPRVCGANAATEARRTRSKRIVFIMVGESKMCDVLMMRVIGS